MNTHNHANINTYLHGIYILYYEKNMNIRFVIRWYLFKVIIIYAQRHKLNFIK